MNQLRYIICLVWLLASLGGVAQIKVEATPTGKHAESINQAKQTRQAAKARRQQIRQYNRQLKEQKKAKKLFMLRYDSARAYQIDSLEINTFTAQDSIALANDILQSTSFPQEYRQLILYPPVLNPDLTKSEGNLDSLAMRKTEVLAEQVAREYMPDELGSQQDPMKALTSPEGSSEIGLGTSALKAMTKPNPNLVKPEVARELFKKIEPEQFQEAQADIQKLKKKYSQLPDTRYPEEGTKRNSLQNIPFSKRIYIGGNISLASTDPLVLSSNLQLGYWLNKKWLAGVGFTLREQFSKQDSSSLVTGDGYGFSVFTRYDIPKGFFAWAESEFQVNRSFFGSAEQARPQSWERAYLLGIGREFKVGGVQMMSIIMYDFNYQSNELNNRPLVFRLGVRFTKRPG